MEVAEVLRMKLNWKATGRDQIANFWLKQLTATHTYFGNLFQQSDKGRSNARLANDRHNNSHSKER